MTKTIQQGTKAAVIYSNTEAGPFSVRLYVNCGARLGDATLIARRFASLKGAEKFAAKVVL